MGTGIFVMTSFEVLCVFFVAVIGMDMGAARNHLRLLRGKEGQGGVAALARNSNHRTDRLTSSLGDVSAGRE